MVTLITAMGCKMPRFTDTDKAVLSALTGADRIRALLSRKGFPSTAQWAYATRLRPDSVSQCINGYRPYPEIRDALATELDLTRAQVDALIDGADQPQPRGAA